MELRQLRYYVQTCTSGTVTAAAAVLFVTEQTVSYALKKLEAELGCTLLVRSKQGVSPTPEGAVLLEKARALVGQADDILATFKRPRELSGTVRFRICQMAVPEHAGFSMQALECFHETYPQVEVVTIECPTRNCIKAVLDGDADLAFVYSTPKASEFETHLLFEGEVVMALASSHPLAKHDELRIDDLRGEKILYAGNGGDTFKTLVERCAERGFEPDFHTVSSLYYLDSAAAGKGLAPALAGHPLLELKQGLVTRHFADEDRLTVPLNFVVRRDLKADSPARALMDWLLQAWRKPE